MMQSAVSRIHYGQGIRTATRMLHPTSKSFLAASGALRNYSSLNDMQTNRQKSTTAVGSQFDRLESDLRQWQAKVEQVNEARFKSFEENAKHFRWMQGATVAATALVLGGMYYGLSYIFSELSQIKEDVSAYKKDTDEQFKKVDEQFKNMDEKIDISARKTDEGFREIRELIKKIRIDGERTP